MELYPSVLASSKKKSGKRKEDLPYELTFTDSGFVEMQGSQDAQGKQAKDTLEKTAVEISPEIGSEIDSLKGKLQDIFGYKNSRRAELEKSFYIKPLFILNNARPQKDKSGEAIMLLAADQDTLFRDADSNFRGEYLNHGFLSNRRQAAGELKGAGDDKDNPVQSQLIEKALRVGFRRGEALQMFEVRADVELARKIMFAFIRKAKSSNRSVDQWLYLLRHVALSENNREYYERKYQIDSEGYLDSSRSFPTDRASQTGFIRELRKNHSPYQTEMVDFEVCGKDFEVYGKDFEGLVSECVDNSICTRAFYEKVIWCLAVYFDNEKMLNRAFSEESRSPDAERILRSYPVFKKRYERICGLRDKFLHTKDFLSEITSVKIDWNLEQREDNNRTNLIAKKIVEYCLQENIISKKEEGDLELGIKWILCVDKFWNTSKDEAIQAILILAFILSGADFLKSDTVIQIFPDWSKHTKKENQRFRQIKLFDAIHDAMDLSRDLRVKSWNEYFLRRGKEIRSEEELRFWRDKIKGDYECLPIIGFQLCFLDYCRDCMSPHLEWLSYSSVIMAAHHVFSNFYHRNEYAVQNFAARIAGHTNDDVKSAVENYRKLWKSPGSGIQERRNAVQPLIELLKNDGALFPVIQSDNSPGFQPEELMYLTVEAAVRMVFVTRAQDKLARWFDETYGCSVGKICTSLHWK